MQGQSEAFDAIVVGSGISGGWAAKELTERGLRVLLLERGKNIEHGKDYTARAQGAVGVPASRRPHARAGRRVSRAQARLPARTRSSPTGGSTSRSRPTPRSSGSTGTAATTWAGARSRGAARAIAIATSTSRPTRGRASRSTGRFATPTSPRGTTTSSGTPASAARSRACRSCPTDSSSRRCR